MLAEEEEIAELVEHKLQVVLVVVAQAEYRTELVKLQEQMDLAAAEEEVQIAVQMVDQELLL
jgi:predicted aspartyl protease